MKETQAMLRALELARRGWGRVAPNPLVGAVLLKNGEIIGEGYHAEYGGAHAEVAALQACDDPSGATCIVTLEPCHHRGKTPPCTDALVAAGVTRVVAALEDPNPEAGGGLQRLRQEGVGVEVGLARQEAAALNAAFLWNTVRPERPFVAVKLAASIDGFVADRAGRSKWISGTEARDFVQWLRAGFDAIAVGRRTAVADDPLLTVRGPVRPRTTPVRVVLSASGDLPKDLRLFTTPEEAATIIVTGPGRVVRLREAFDDRVAAVLGATTLTDAMRQLKETGVGSILVEGGGVLATALLEEELVDRLYWIEAPILLGAGTPAFGERRGISLEEVESWAVTDRRALGDDTLLVMDRRLCLQGS